MHRAAFAQDLAAIAAQIDAEEQAVARLEQQAAPFERAPRRIAPESDSPVPLYFGGGGEIDRIDEHQRLAARHALLVELERGKVTEVDYDDGTATRIFSPPWEKAGFVIAPVEVLLAIRTAATAPYRGVELDLRVPTQERGVHFVTLVHELDGAIRVTDVPQASARSDPPAASLSDAALQRRFGVGRLDGGEGRWSAVERLSLSRALELLSKAERARVGGIELRRESRPRRIIPVKGSCGVTTSEGAALWIEIFDCAFRNDDIAFTGRPQAPERASTRLILHELGHVLGLAPIQAFRSQLQDVSKQGAATSQRLAQLHAGEPELSVFVGRLAKVAARLQAVAKATADTSGPVVTAFSQIPGAENGVTRYGRASPSEAFAEAFSLYRADPAALRRISPALLEFFEQGRHLPKLP
ncbi:MAG TPA: hypothetical protein VMR50_10500 [Myxococcota bacterium]|nr:hypothetical protein [Myxococcota bacterium]